MLATLAIVLAAAVLIAGTLQDAFEVMLLPRRIDRRLRLARIYFRVSWAGFKRVAALLPDGPRRIRVLGAFGPGSMVLLFALWAALLITGFGLLEWALQGSRPGHVPLGDDLYLSGATFFTLGYGDIVPHSEAARALAVVESGTGLGFIAVVIGYLPVLYQMFARREAHVLQLDTRAGSPPTAAAMLVLHAELDGLAALNALLAEWENWSAELLESHLSYPMLVFYRSQHDDQSWLAAMAAVMDTCAVVLTGLDGMPVLQARMTFTMARGMLVAMCQALRVAPTPYEGHDRLPPATFALLDTRLAAAGLHWRDGAGAAETLLALRATYEPLLDGLRRLLLLPLPPFVAENGAAEHWGEGPRGLIASRLVAQLSDVDAARSAALAADDARRLGHRLRRRLAAR